ncbi:MAG TPA: thioesterase family protein [Gemmatimonadales bacterium]|nr:thioesterase family protein [Gemmatimonadales bacterium]
MTHPDLAHFPVVVRAMIHWGEMDAYGHLNNTVFFRFFETARMAYLERCGFLATYERDRVGAILHSTDCRFRAPLFYPDDVLIGARVLDVGADRFRMGYRVVSVSQNRTAAEGTGLIVAYDYKAGSKVELPEAVREGIRRLEHNGMTG